MQSSEIFFSFPRFLNYIHNEVIPDLAKKNITVAVMAERSIDDEIERESAGDVSTIIISYTVMFVYVTLALGEFNSFERILVSNLRDSIAVCIRAILKRSTVIFDIHDKSNDLLRLTQRSCWASRE